MGGASYEQWQMSASWLRTLMKIRRLLRMAIPTLAVSHVIRRGVTGTWLYEVAFCEKSTTTRVKFEHNVEEVHFSHHYFQVVTATGLAKDPQKWPLLPLARC